MGNRASIALQPGSRLGRYELLRFAGEGGFGEVWLGQRADVRGGPPVAIKVVRRGRAGDAADRAMFLDEANITARIRHPNVPTVYEVGDERGLPYLVMEYVAGGSLEAIERGARTLEEPVPIAIAMRLVADICGALHAAHELAIDGRPHHVIHRDVSPENILISDAGVPKLIDFGIAMARERLSKVTTTGIAKGKIAYMSPEQARGETLDRRADLWSVGAVAYELLEGRQLFDRGNDLARMLLLTTRPVKPVFRRAPERIAAIVRRALAFESGERQSTAEEVQLEIEWALGRDGLATSPEGIAAYCRRARIAAEATPAPEDGSFRFGALPAVTANATVSSVGPSSGTTQPYTWWSRRAWPWLAGSAAFAVAVTVAVRVRLDSRASGAAARSDAVATVAMAAATTAPPAAQVPPTVRAEAWPLPAAPMTTAAIPTAPPSAPSRASPVSATRARASASPPKARARRLAPKESDDDRID